VGYDPGLVLSIGVIGGRAGDGRSAGYYTSSVAKGRDDYYTGKGEAPGEWFGEGAEALGLVGEVDGAAFRAVVMEAVAPGAGEPLRRLARDRPVYGFDMTFSAPKSVSLLFFLGDEAAQAAVRQAHDGAVAAALGYMQREACLVREGQGGSKGRAVAEGFVGATFRHRTSRALDPQLHTHAVVANLAQRRGDGKYVALDGAAIYAQAKTGGYLYQAELRARLTASLGVEWGQLSNGTAEIAGVARPVVEEFSKRRRAIVDTMDARREYSPRSAQDAALETRPDKSDADLSQLVEEWRAVAAELGFGQAEVDSVAGRLEQRPRPDGAELAALTAAMGGERGLTERASTFDRRQVLQAVCAGHRHGAAVARVEQLAGEFTSSPRVVPLEGGAVVTGPDTLRRRDGSLVVRATGVRYTTPEMLDRETRLVHGAQRRRGAGAGVASPEGLEAALSRPAGRPALSGEQAAMVRSLAGSGDGVQVVRAAAGTGKTHALDAARRAWQHDGRRVYGAALSARAALELRDTGGIDSTTVASLLTDFERGYGLAEGGVLVVDEAGMVGTRALERLAGACQDTATKLVLVGDDRQLPEIDAGGAFRGLAARLGAVELTEVFRQSDRADIAALADLRAGRAGEWLRSADERGHVVVERTVDGQYEHLVSDWWHGREGLEGGGEAMMFAPTREAAAELNERAQAYMRHSGRLGERALAGPRDVRFAEGDRVMCLQNAERDVGVLNGQRGTVVAVEESTFSLQVQIDGGEEVVLPGSYIDDGNVGLGYAMTVHKSQGMSVERAYVLGGEGLYAQLAYTALSRHRERCRFYVNAGEVAGAQLELELGGEARDEALEQIERTIGVDRAQQMALDVHETDDALRALPDGELAARAGELAELLASYPVHARAAARLRQDLERRGTEIRADEQRLAAAREQREALGRRERARRAELDERIARDEEILAAARAAYGELADSASGADTAGHEWLERHRAELAQATVVERELAARRQGLYEQALAQAAHDPASETAELLGPRPGSLLEAERWDAAAASVESYRLAHGELPGPDAPTDGPRRRAWQKTRRARGELRELQDPALTATLEPVPAEVDGPDIDL